MGRLRQRPQTQQPEATNTPLPLDPDHRGQVLDDLQSQIVAAWSQSSAEFKESVRQILDRVLDEIDPETSQVSGVGDHRPITFSRKAVMGIVTAISLILVAVAVVLALVSSSSKPVSLAAPTTFPTLLPGVSQRSVAVAPYLPVTPPAPTLPIPVRSPPTSPPRKLRSRRRSPPFTGTSRIVRSWSCFKAERIPRSSLLGTPPGRRTRKSRRARRPWSSGRLHLSERCRRALRDRLSRTAHGGAEDRLCDPRRRHLEGHAGDVLPGHRQCGDRRPLLSAGQRFPRTRRLPQGIGPPLSLSTPTCSPVNIPIAVVRTTTEPELFGTIDTRPLAFHTTGNTLRPVV